MYADQGVSASRATEFHYLIKIALFQYIEVKFGVQK